jgi:transcriptional regulator with XRE-family HTH domain
VPNKQLLYQEFGIALANERRRKHLSQAQFAAKVGMSRTSVTNIECGRQPIQLHQLYVFASILQVDVVKLLPKEVATAEAASVHSTSDKKDYYIAQVVKAVTQGKP